MKKSSKYWDKWQSDLEEKLKSLGYRKFIQNYKREDFTYWKTFQENGEKIYQVGVLFYDFRKYDKNLNISIQYECMLLNTDRIDFSVSKEIKLEEFESMSKTFYESMKQFI